ncbi:MAG: dodecin family protein [Thermaurantiacus sp.]
MAIAKTIEIISSSTESIEHAVKDGLERARKTIDNIEGVWVKDIKAQVRDGKLVEWRIIMVVTFVLND